MYNKNSKTPSKYLKLSVDMKSRTPSKQIKKEISSSKPLNMSISSIKSSTIHDHSSEPVRMAIKLEDILKSGTQQIKSVNLKPELIEPEIESSIPFIEYPPKSNLHISNNTKTLKITEKLQKIEENRGTPVFNDFSLEKMNDECKDFEKNLLNESRHIGEIQLFLAEKFKCRVKLKPEIKTNKLPSVVLVKTGNRYEVFNIIKY